MGTILFSYNAIGKLLTLDTVGNEESWAPGSNVFRDHPGDLWQTSDLTDVYLELENPTGATWDTIALLYTNGKLGDDWRIRTASSQANLTAGPTYDSGSMEMYDSAAQASSVVRPALHRVSPGRSEAWLRIDITSTTDDGYFRVGNLIVDAPLAPARNFQLPLDIGQQARFDMRLVSEADMMALHDQDVLYEDEPALIVFDPDESSYLHNKLVWGLVEPGQGPRLTSKGLWSRRYAITPYI